MEIGVGEGDIVAGCYRLDFMLGTGAVGVVFAAHHLRLDERVAIKFLLPQILSDPGAAHRFEREARAAVKIKSEHAARIRDVDTTDDGAPFMVMEYLEGEDLASLLKRTGPLDVEEAVDFVVQACGAVIEAHALGIVHGDLKPANLFCMRGSGLRPAIKVLDFGVPRFSREGWVDSGVGKGKSSGFVGLPYYMSPEQVKSSRHIDAHTDIWSIGVILYQLLTGDVPFAGATSLQVMMAVTTRPAPSLRRYRPDAPAELGAVVSRCLEKDPDQRYPSVVELAAALIRFAPKRAPASIGGASLAFRNTSVPASAFSLPPPASKSNRPSARGQWWNAPLQSLTGRAPLDVTGLVAAGMLVSAMLALVWSRNESRASAAQGTTIDSAASEPNSAFLEKASSAAHDFTPLAVDLLLDAVEAERKTEAPALVPPADTDSVMTQPDVEPPRLMGEP